MLALLFARNLQLALETIDIRLGTVRIDMVLKEILLDADAALLAGRVLFVTLLHV